MFSYSSSKSIPISDKDQHIGTELSHLYTGFTKGNQAVNHYFWLLGLQPTIRETDENQGVTPQNGCSSYNFQNVKFAYPLAPKNTVLKGVSLNVSLIIQLINWLFDFLIYSPTQ